MIEMDLADDRHDVYPEVVGFTDARQVIKKEE